MWREAMRAVCLRSYSGRDGPIAGPHGGGLAGAARGLWRAKCAYGGDFSETKGMCWVMGRPAGSISIGEMAKLNQVSLKTLRLWQARGLLEPAYVDPWSGYRYYSIEQCATVDVIVQLRDMGFTLDEISRLLQRGDVAELRDALKSKMDYLEEQRRRIAEAQASLSYYLKECDACEEEVLCNQILLERTPSRRAYFFDSDPMDIETPGFEPFLEWECALRRVKEEFGRQGLPRSLFRNFASLIRSDDLRRGTLLWSGVVVFVDEAYSEAFARAQAVPACQRLVMYMRHCKDDGGGAPEAPLIRRMLDYAAAKHLEVAGDYMSETVADTPLFGYEGRDAFFKLAIPVRRA